MVRRKKKRRAKLSEAQAQLIAKVIVMNPDMLLKQIAADYNISYSLVYKILKERVNVTKTLFLRYPDEENGISQLSRVSHPISDK